MDARLLDYYNQELSYMRELGGEFAQAFPKVASRLGMTGVDIADPYVERLLEGFAFLTARIHLKMDAEFPRFSQRLLEVVYPHYLSPTPSMCVVELPLEGALSGVHAAGMTVPRGTALHSAPVGQTGTRCTFVTGHDVQVWPIELVDVLAGTPTAPLLNGGVSRSAQVKGVIRLRFRAKSPGALAHCDIAQLGLFLGGEARVASQLYELLLGHTLGLLVSVGDGTSWRPVVGGEIKPQGFACDQALLPVDARVFQGYRLLHEYFAFPERFHFLSLEGLAPALRHLPDDGFELAILLDRAVDHLASSIDRGSFVLNCTPTINLFPYRANRVRVPLSEFEHHVVPDRTRPLDFEVYGIGGVQGFDKGNSPLTAFRPFFQSLDTDTKCDGAYFSFRRESRRLSESAARSGTRSGYLGSEVFLSLVDGAQAPWNESIEQLSLQMSVTNRDLPLLMHVTGHHDFTVDGSTLLPFANIVRGPTPPRVSVAEREQTWRLISHLSLNYLALRDLDEANGAVAVRELLGLYAGLADPSVARHGESIVASSVQGVTRRLPGAGPLVFGRGVNVELLVDESVFAGHSPYLFGCVLEQYFCRHVSLNTFTELTLRCKQTGRSMVWEPRWGGRPDA